MKAILIGSVLAIALGYGGAKAYLHYHVSKGMDSAIQMMAGQMEMEYGGVSSTLTGELTVDDVRIRVNGYRDDFVIGRMGINTPNFLALLDLSKMSDGSQAENFEMPEYFGFIFEEIQIPAWSDYYNDYYTKTIEATAPPDIRQGGVQCVGKYGYSPKALSALGYDELVLSTSLILRQTDTHYIAEIDFDIEEMIDVEMDLEMDGSLMMLMAAGPGYRPTLRSLQLKLTDNSLNERTEKYCTELGLTPEQILRAHLDALQYFGGTNGIEFDEYVINPYKEYLAGKSTLIVTANPREPLELDRIKQYKPSDVPALLNLEAIAQ